MHLKNYILFLIGYLCLPFCSFGQQLQFELLTKADGLSSNQILDISQDQLGFLWINTSKGWNRFDGKKFMTATPTESFANNAKTSNLSLSNGDEISIQNNNSLTFYDSKKNKSIDYNLDLLLDQPINQLFQDRTGIIWGTSEQGLLKIKYQTPLFDTYLSDGDIFCSGTCKMRGIAEDSDGNIYFSHYNSIQVLDPSTNTISPLLPNRKNFNTPFDLVVFDNHLWTNSSKRVNLLDKKISTMLPQSQANDFDNGNFMVDKKGNLWLGRDGDLWQYNAKTDQLVWSDFSEKLSNGEITYLLPSEDKNHFWIGTNESGVFKMDFSKGIVRQFSTANSNLKSNFVRVLFEDTNNTLWIGTPSGLYQLDLEKNQIARYAVEDGLPNDNINSILPEGDSCLWIGTDLGLSRFHKTEKSFINFFVRDGLPDNEFNRISFHKAKNGRMYLGGLNGIVAFYPQEVMKAYRQNQKQSKVVLTAFIKQNEMEGTPVLQPINHSEELDLEIYHQDNVYTFEFALTDYLASDEVHFSYQLEGFDYDFSPPSKSNSVQYYNLHRGKYTLHVKAKDAKGGWNPNPISVPITVHPPWWKSTAAYFGYLLLLGSLIYGVFRFLRNRWQLKSQLDLEHQEAVRLKDINNFKTRLYANITHEFRTPLTVILGLSDQIEENIDEIAPDRIKKHMGLISSNGKNLLHLINQMLDLSKLESSSMSVKMIQSDLISYLRSIANSFDFFAETQKVNLIFETEVENLEMDFDKDKMLKIVSNLISNGIKYTKEGGSVSLHIEVPSDQTLVLKVIDTGIGIPKEALPHIFDRFFQATTEQLQKQIGTGIGLSLVQELVRLFNGKIKVESEVGVGSTFTIHLPILKNAPTEAALPKIASIQEAVDAYTIWSQGKMADVQTIAKRLNVELPTLLIIEDNKDIITYLQTILQPFYHIEIATDGKIGVDMAVEIIPDIVLSDVMMPEMDGFEVCNFLKNDERTSHIPIVMLTARSEIQSRLEGLERGADAYLSKPFNKSELLIRLEKLIELRKKLQARYAGFEKIAPSQEKAVQIEDAFLQKLRDEVENKMDDPTFGIPELCKAVHLSRMQVHRKLKALTGQTASHFIRSIRLQKAKQLLQTNKMNISEVAYEVGFNDPNYFSRTFSKEYGMSPSQFLENQA